MSRTAKWVTGVTLLATAAFVVLALDSLANGEHWQFWGELVVAVVIPLRVWLVARRSRGLVRASKLPDSRVDEQD